MRAAGLRVESRMNNRVFLAKLAAQSPEFLKKTLQYGGLTDLALTADRAALLRTADGSGQWRSAALDHIRKTLLLTGFRYQYCYAAVQLMQFPLVKKGPDLRSVIARARYLAAVQAGDLPAPPGPILTELTQAVAYDLAQNYDWQRPGPSLD